MAGSDLEMALVTGAQTFLGWRFCREILKQRPDAVVVLLAEAGSEVALEQQVASLPEQERRRCQVVVGTTSSIDLGLTSDQYKSLASKLTEIYHVHERAYGNPRELARVNVDGTREVCEFAGSCSNLQRLVHLSSVEVSGDRRGVVLESELDEGQHFLDLYQKTKFKGEVLVSRWARRVPTTIVRSGLVVGSSRDGTCDTEGPGFRVLGALLDRSRRLDGSTVPLNVVPWDFLTSFTVRLARDSGAVGRCFHVLDPSPIGVGHASRLVRRLAHRPAGGTSLPAAVLDLADRLPGVGRFVGRTAWRIPPVLETMVFYNQRNTLARAAAFGLLCPPFEDYAANLVRFFTAKMRQRHNEPSSRQRIPDPLE